MTRRNDELFDLVSILSLVIGLQNLQENREQSAHNDVKSANEEQEKHLLQELRTMFEEQNAMLKSILARLEVLTCADGT